MEKATLKIKHAKEILPCSLLTGYWCDPVGHAEAKLFQDRGCNTPSSVAPIPDGYVCNAPFCPTEWGSSCSETGAHDVGEAVGLPQAAGGFAHNFKLLLKPARYAAKQTAGTTTASHEGVACTMGHHTPAAGRKGLTAFVPRSVCSFEIRNSLVPVPYPICPSAHPTEIWVHLSLLKGDSLPWSSRQGAARQELCVQQLKAHSSPQADRFRAPLRRRGDSHGLAAAGVPQTHVP